MNWDRLRLALVGPLPPPVGGMATQTEQLAALLRSEGAVVELVPTNAPYRPQWIGRLRGLRALFRLVPFVVALWRAFGRADAVHLMANSGVSWFVFAAPAILVARLRRRPVVVNYRGGAAAEFLRRAQWGVRPLVRQTAALVVPSGFLVDIFARHGMRAEILPNIVDNTRFAPGTGSASGAPPHIVVTRNLEPIYDIPSALRAFAIVRREFPGATMTIAGEGPLRAELELLAAQLNVAPSVAFAGRIDHGRIPELYRRATLFLNPSQVDNMPNSVLEALACGVPVVSTNVGGVTYIVEHERTALLVPRGDATAMAAAMARILRDPALAAGLRAAGLEVARRCDWPSIRPRLLAVYSAAVRHESTTATHLA